VYDRREPRVASLLRPIVISLLSFLALGMTTLPSRAVSPEHVLILAQQTATPADKDDDSLEAKYKRRYPQPTKVGHLIGLPVLDDNDVTLGHVQKVVRTPEGKIELIVSYSKWFGWFGRPVAVPLEAVVILALQLDSVEMQPEDYAEAPTWTEGKDQVLADDDIVRVALGRR
jgi:PRC-barrel domain